MIYTEAQQADLMKTARTSGAVGKNALLSRVIRKVGNMDLKYLDYGSGPAALHTVLIRADGYNVVAHDINPEKTKWHINTKLSGYDGWFDVVFASNVLNVQPTIEHVRDVVSEVDMMLKLNGTALFNYPVSPRKTDLVVSEVDAILKEQFRVAERIRKIGDWKLDTTPVWQCAKGD